MSQEDCQCACCCASITIFDNPRLGGLHPDKTERKAATLPGDHKGRRWQFITPSVHLLGGTFFAPKGNRGTEIFVPEIRAYDINELKAALFELLENTGEKTTGIRAGEKLNEVLINDYEIPYSWKINGMYMIVNPALNNQTISELSGLYPGIKPVEKMKDYSSNNVEKISKEELKEIIKKVKLV